MRKIIYLTVLLTLSSSVSLRAEGRIPDDGGELVCTGVPICQSSTEGPFSFSTCISSKVDFLCSGPTKEFSAGNNHGETDFASSYHTPSGFRLVGPGLVGSIHGRETFQIYVSVNDAHRLSCRWFTRGGPMFGSGGYVNGNCAASAVLESTKQGPTGAVSRLRPLTKQRE
jgi:hypothetical protein